MKYGWLLTQAASVPMNELWGNGDSLEDGDFYEEIVKKYQSAWSPYQTKILTAMQELLGIEFRQSIIDVYVAPWFNAFSDPMVFGVMYEPDRFVDVFTHELLHRLMTDSKQLSHDYEIDADWRRLFGDDHSQNTLIHIPVHAVHKAILLDILKEPERYDREIALTSKWPDYKAAWQYVNAHDYKKIIEDLHKLYKPR